MHKERTYMKSEKESPNPNLNDKQAKSILIDREQLFEILKNEMDLEILLLLFMHHELNLTQLAEIFHKSKATISRHLKKMVEIGIVDFRSEKIRGVEAKFFHADFQQFLSIKSYSIEDTKKMGKEDQGVRQLENIRDVILSLLIFGKKNLDDISDYLRNLSSGVDGELVKMFSKEPPFSYTINFLTEEQYQKYKLIQQEIGMKVWQMMQETKTNNADKPYFVINGIFPHKSFLKKTK
ncbi:hypothetical protein NEF87_002194 [Candidatus Lokiarchaeum ossiferum]|uniref:HTH arsR-type domain-containing protein n=1 Tax=Candidatus Lokiarchaeum ossiferum TaxID=2951803 RepID=A0ABY6HQX9_9ARCH|nr:hypothetical protein NEF87_002194 [Candidatus Lokiarchaeum sp. B-35]